MELGENEVFRIFVAAADQLRHVGAWQTLIAVEDGKGGNLDLGPVDVVNMCWHSPHYGTAPRFNKSVGIGNDGAWWCSAKLSATHPWRGCRHHHEVKVVAK